MVNLKFIILAREYSFLDKTAIKSAYDEQYKNRIINALLEIWPFIYSGV